MWRNSTAARPGAVTGFTLTEIMVVIGILGLLAAMVIPNYLNARQRSQAVLCTEWLERIAGAKAQVAFADRLRPTETPSDSALIAYIHQDQIITALDGTTELCPAGGTYAVNNVGSNPTCSMASGSGLHQLE